MIDLVWDMETNDPDDLFTLMFLAGHPEVNLKAVTVVPGAPDQIGLVRWVLAQFDLNIPIGSGRLDDPKPRVSEWYYEVYGKISPSQDALLASEVLLTCCDRHTVLVAGAPLTNLRSAIEASSDNKPFEAARLVVQGGFAGEGVVPPEKQLEKFKGMVTCETYNLNHDTKAAFAVLDHAAFGVKRFVSKNVCHGVYYDPQLHQIFAELKNNSLSLALIWQGMEAYFKLDPKGKKFHDPLAACCAIDESVGEWAEVELFREKGKWGARLANGSGIWIIVDYDHQKFVKILTAIP